MAVAYRLFQARFGPCDPTGARLRGGRWSSPGQDILYASDSLALCCLEVLVHIRDTRFVPSFEYCAINIPDDLIGVWPLQHSDPRHTAILQSPVLSQEFGDEFLQMNANLVGAVDADYVVVDGPAEGSLLVRGWPGLPVQAVPSVVIPDSFNFLIDLNQERFRELVWNVPHVFEFEPRLLNPDLR